MVAPARVAGCKSSRGETRILAANQRGGELKLMAHELGTGFGRQSPLKESDTNDCFRPYVFIHPRKLARSRDEQAALSQKRRITITNSGNQMLLESAPAERRCPGLLELYHGNSHLFWYGFE